MTLSNTVRKLRNLAKKDYSINFSTRKKNIFSRKYFSLAFAGAAASTAAVQGFAIKKYLRKFVPGTSWCNTRLDQQILVLTVSLFAINLFFMLLVYHSSVENWLVGGFFAGASIMIYTLLGYLLARRGGGTVQEIAPYFKILAAVPIGLFGLLMGCGYFIHLMHKFTFSNTSVWCQNFLLKFTDAMCLVDSAGNTAPWQEQRLLVATAHVFEAVETLLEENLLQAHIMLGSGATLSEINNILQDHIYLIQYTTSQINFVHLICGTLVMLHLSTKADLTNNFLYGTSELSVYEYIFRGVLDYYAVLSYKETCDALPVSTIDNANEILSFISTSTVYLLENKFAGNLTLLILLSAGLLTRYIICAAIMYIIVARHQKAHNSKLLAAEQIITRQYDKASLFSAYGNLHATDQQFVYLLDLPGNIQNRLVLFLEGGGVVVGHTSVIIKKKQQKLAIVKLLYGSASIHGLSLLTAVELAEISILILSVHARVFSVYNCYAVVLGMLSLKPGALVYLGTTGLGYLCKHNLENSEVVLLTGHACSGQNVIPCGVVIRNTPRAADDFLTSAATTSAYSTLAPNVPITSNSLNIEQKFANSCILLETVPGIPYWEWKLNRHGRWVKVEMHFYRDPAFAPHDSKTKIIIKRYHLVFTLYVILPKTMRGEVYRISAFRAIYVYLCVTYDLAHHAVRCFIWHCRALLLH